MSQLSRRTVLRGAVVAAAAAAVPVGLAGIAHGAPLSATRLRRREFEPLVGSTFTFGHGGTAYASRLVSVSDVHKPSDTRFSLLFQLTGSARPGDGVFQVGHPQLRTFDLYAGGVGLPADGYYESIVAY